MRSNSTAKGEARKIGGMGVNLERDGCTKGENEREE